MKTVEALDRARKEEGRIVKKEEIVHVSVAGFNQVFIHLNTGEIFKFDLQDLKNFDFITYKKRRMYLKINNMKKELRELTDYFSVIDAFAGSPPINDYYEKAVKKAEKRGFTFSRELWALTCQVVDQP